ncbi:hypothetical protein [Noviherbaspirillum sp. Root189]|uniref:hypothetical protein n=1 Tax=Noviherbaspirillum sp. Root189 TaxID=1736487 RepID=UPI000710B986|nr:hypothetical protein [Noviherbaspirillum sp. Root189]KRB79063.1 hypothetical protein ASE07_05080 [Noviherbaspirillum sp. Root189]
MRIVQPAGTRGSLKWMQRLASSYPQLLDDAMREAGGLQTGETIRWVSPRKDDEWAEYRDRDFLVQVGQERLTEALAGFWPRGGPQWDALGVSSNGTVLLVEAKAHLAELTSTCQASPASRAVIQKSLEATKAAFGAAPNANWLEGYYQYANRLAHLHFFQNHRVPSKLIFVYFMDDADMKGPRSPSEWKEGLSPVYKHLGFDSLNHVPDLVNLYIDTKALVAI